MICPLKLFSKVSVGILGLREVSEMKEVKNSFSYEFGPLILTNLEHTA